MNTTLQNNAGYDQVVIGIGLEWLAQYARFLRRAPELVGRLSDRSDAFELIPIPKVLLERLAVPGLIGSGNLGDLDSEMQRFIEFDLTKFSQKVATFSREPAFDNIRKFAAAIEAGDAAAARALLSPRFINPDGKNVEEIHQTLERLFAHTSNRRFRVLGIEETQGGEAEFVARVKGIWSASPREDESADPLCETVCLEVLLNLQAEGDWKISGVRSV